MELKAGGLRVPSLTTTHLLTSPRPWEYPAPAEAQPFHQVGHPELPHEHPGAHPSGYHMFTTQISQQLPPPRSLPLTLGGGTA